MILVFRACYECKDYNSRIELIKMKILHTCHVIDLNLLEFVAN